MTQNTQVVSPLRQRMIENMMLRKLSPKTQSAYIRSVKKLSSYLGHYAVLGINDTVLPHTYWKRRSIYASFRYCWGIKNWKQPRSMHRLPPIFYVR